MQVLWCRGSLIEQYREVRPANSCTASRLRAQGVRGLGAGTGAGTGRRLEWAAARWTQVGGVLAMGLVLVQRRSRLPASPPHTPSSRCFTSSRRPSLLLLLHLPAWWVQTTLDVPDPPLRAVPPPPHPTPPTHTQPPPPLPPRLWRRRRCTSLAPCCTPLLFACSLHAPPPAPPLPWAFHAQMTLYVPGPVLRAGNNEVLLLELEHAPDRREGERAPWGGGLCGSVWFGSAATSEWGRGVGRGRGREEGGAPACLWGGVPGGPSYGPF